MGLTGIQMLTNGTGTGWVAIAAGGNHFTNTGDEYLWINNTNAGSTVTVKIVTQIACSYGGLHTEHDVSITVAASSQMVVGKLPTARFNDASGYTYLTYTGTPANVKIAIIKVA